MSSSQAPWSWSAPVHRSRCGASHQRRGVPCQDFSLSTSLQSADGLSVGLMAVADGHGGSRYWLSDVGSRLACELAIQLAVDYLARQPLNESEQDQQQSVQRWLTDELPGRILAAWHAAIRADWQKRQLPEERKGETFSPRTYGSTLALVVLTPMWWAHTGLGDWDLVLLRSEQPDCIISQERNDSLQGEATESLCLPSAVSCFAARTAVYSLLEEPSQARGLVLSTDGVRKSCAADADHLALSRFLLEEIQQQERSGGETHLLDTSLDRISKEGSGDDVSVALAYFGELHPSTATVVAQQSAQPPQSRLVGASSSAPANAARKRNPAGALMLATTLLATGGIAAVAWFGQLPAWIWPQPTPTVAVTEAQAPTPSATQEQGLRQQIKRLCSHPALIKANLKARKTQFNQLRNDPAELKRVFSEKDWLGSLIGLSQPGGQGLGNVQMCPELTLALRQHWQDTPDPGPSRAGSDD